MTKDSKPDDGAVSDDALRLLWAERQRLAPGGDPPEEEWRAWKAIQRAANEANFRRWAKMD